MEDQLNKYKVDYHTKPGVGSTYYEGSITVFAEDDEQAAERAQREVQRNAFRDYNRSHIVIDSVTRSFR